MLTSQAIFNYNSSHIKTINPQTATNSTAEYLFLLYLFEVHLASCIVTYCGDISLQISFHSHKNQSALTILQTYLMMKFMLFQPEQNLTDSQMNKV